MRLVAFIAALPLAACSLHSGSDDSKPGVAADGTGTTRSFAIADFTGVELRGSDDVDVRIGTSFSVRAEGPSEELDKLKIEKVNDRLHVGRRNIVGFHWGDTGDHVKIYVTMPRITEAGVSGSGDMSIDRVDGQNFAGNSAGSGDLDIATINVESGTFAIQGSGNIKLKGSAKKLAIDIAGSGDVDGKGLSAEGARISITGSGGVHAAVNGPATVSLIGSGDVDLGPGARCSTSKTGSGDVHCGG